MAVDFFLKIDGIKGESGDDKHKEEIELLSWSWGESNPIQVGGVGGMSAGKVNMQDLHTTQLLNKASPDLFLACANGKHIKEMLLTVRKAGEKPLEYLKIKFTEVMVSSYQTGGAGGTGEHAHEQTSFAFSKIDVEYQPQDEKGSAKGGSVKAGYDLRAAKKT